MDSQRDFVRLRVMACLSERFCWLGGGVIFSHRRKKEREGCLFTYIDSASAAGGVGRAESELLLRYAGFRITARMAGI